MSSPGNPVRFTLRKRAVMAYGRGVGLYARVSLYRGHDPVGTMEILA